MKQLKESEFKLVAIAKNGLGEAREIADVKKITLTEYVKLNEQCFSLKEKERKLQENEIKLLNDKIDILTDHFNTAEIKTAYAIALSLYLTSILRGEIEEIDDLGDFIDEIRNYINTPQNSPLRADLPIDFKSILDTLL